MNWHIWLLVGAMLQGPTISYSNTLVTATALTLPPEQSCTFKNGETVPVCTGGARWTEIIKILKVGQQDLVCGVVEQKYGNDWVVFESRLFCFRGRAQVATR